MAPHQDECWDNHVPLACVCNLQSYDLSMMEEMSNSPGAATLKQPLWKMTQESNPWINYGCRRARRVCTSVDEDYCSMDDNTTLPSHWPSKQVHFPYNAMVTEVHTRPFTDEVDVPTLFYSLDDIGRFKREYRHLLKMKILHIQRSELSQEEPLTRPHHDFSWRRTVSRRFSGSTSLATSSIVPSALEERRVEYSSDIFLC